MKNSKAKIFIPIIIVVILAAVGVGIFFFTRDKVTMEMSELMYNFEWGTTRSEVELVLSRQEGLTKGETKLDNILIYKFEDFKGIKGANGNVMFRFDDNNELMHIQYNFNDSSDKVKAKVMKIYTKTLNNYYGESSSVSGTEVWTDSTTYVTKIDNRLVSFENIETISLD